MWGLRWKKVVVGFYDMMANKVRVMERSVCKNTEFFPIFRELGRFFM